VITAKPAVAEKRLAERGYSAVFSPSFLTKSSPPPRPIFEARFAAASKC
jgi:hypothetical protein